MTSYCVSNCYESFKRRIFMILWISLASYMFYDTFIFYKLEPRYYHLRGILGIGLCMSRSTATVLNVCNALVLLPLCRKINQILYRMLSKIWPSLFFFWLERTKSFHMTVAVTLFVFAVIHSISHFCNLWNFSRHYDDVHPAINLASYKNENPILLLLNRPGLTGLSMLLIIVAMALTSLRVVRRRLYNAFWYSHQLYLPFMVLLLIHPLSGVLKEEILAEGETTDIYSSQIFVTYNFTESPRFVAIKSKTWMWMALPLSCFVIDLIWRVFSRNCAAIDILQVVSMPGRILSLKMNCPHENFECHPGQYVLMQCADISLLEWHPFTVVKLPNVKDKDFIIWIKVKGDWTEALENLLMEKEHSRVRMLVDGPMVSPMERVGRSHVALCVAAGVGITPFVPVLQQLLNDPRGMYPGRMHLLWIVRHECEVAILADLATQCLLQLRSANRPDRLHLQIHVTYNASRHNFKLKAATVNEKGVTSILNNINEERVTLLTPHYRRKILSNNAQINNDKTCSLTKDYPIVKCRVTRGRPHWDQVFGYWVHLYPRHKLNLYCCGPKKLVKTLQSKCQQMSHATDTHFTFVHERFS